MLIEKENFVDFFESDFKMELHCPLCKKGLLSPEQKSIKSDSYLPPEYLDDVFPEDEKGVFSCLLKCSGPDCGEVVSCCGSTSYS